MTDIETAMLSALIASAREDEPGMRIDVDDKRVLVGFWFDCATGRTYVCSTGQTFVEALTGAKARRTEKAAQAVVEAEVRAEVEARMAKAA